jgi:hypothetical protein
VVVVVVVGVVVVETVVAAPVVGNGSVSARISAASPELHEAAKKASGISQRSRTIVSD